MLNLQSGDRIELFCEDAPATTVRAIVGRLLTNRDKGMGIEVEDYADGPLLLTSGPTQFRVSINSVSSICSSVLRTNFGH